MPTTPATVRHFAPADFEGALAAMPPEWNAVGCGPQETDALQRLDLAEILSGATYRLVAEVERRIVGMLLACFDDAVPADAAAWEQMAQALKAELAQGSDAARARMTYVECGERAAYDRAVEAAGDAKPAGAEVMLFSVAAEARGTGAGSALLTAFEAHLAARGASGYWLHTDDDCTWQWYERHGFERIADVEKPTRELVDGRPTGCCVKTAGEPGPLHAYVYRKAVEVRPGAAGLAFLPFDRARDFEDVARLVPAEWVWDGAGEQAHALGCQLMLSRMLERCTFALVVRGPAEGTASGELLGVALGRNGRPAPEQASPYEELSADLVRRLAGMPGAERVVADQDAELACDDALLAAAAEHLPDDAEYVLFVTAPAARGKGVGAAMITRFEDYLAATGAGSYYLLTDTGCTYDWYDRHGFVRVAQTTIDYASPAATLAGIRAGADLRGEPAPDSTFFVYRYDLDVAAVIAPTA